MGQGRWHLAMLGALVSGGCDEAARLEARVAPAVTVAVSGAPAGSVEASGPSSVASAAGSPAVSSPAGSSPAGTLPAVAPPPDGRQPILPMAEDAPARRYGAMSTQRCRAAVEARGLPVIAASAAQVRQPMRLRGPLSGVEVILPPAPSPFGVMDCRLVVALDDVARWLAGHGVVAIRADNTHRPDAMMKSGEPSQHALGMAIDIMAFERRDGTVVPVLGTWSAQVGEAPCGPTSRAAVTPDERWLRGIVCMLARRHAFHHMLTPNTDAAHRDHLHFDLDATSTSLFLR